MALFRSNTWGHLRSTNNKMKADEKFQSCSDTNLIRKAIPGTYLFLTSLNPVHIWQTNTCVKLLILCEQILHINCTSTFFLSSYRPCSHYTRGIWKCSFPSGLRRKIWKRDNHRWFWTYAQGSLGQRGHMIILTSSSSKSSVMFSVHSNTQGRRFQIPPVWIAFSKRSVFLTDQCGR